MKEGGSGDEREIKKETAALKLTRTNRHERDSAQCRLQISVV